MLVYFPSNVNHQGLVPELSCRVSDANNLLYLEPYLTKTHIELRGTDHFDLQVIGEHLHPFDQFVDKDPSLFDVGCVSGRRVTGSNDGGHVLLFAR